MISQFDQDLADITGVSSGFQQEFHWVTEACSAGICTAFGFDFGRVFRRLNFAGILSQCNI